MRLATDAGLRHLAAFNKLEYLALHNGHQLTDAALQYLKGLTNLKELSLFACGNITDAGLAHLTTLKSLERVELGQTMVSDKGIATLREHLPKCEIKE